MGEAKNGAQDQDITTAMNGSLMLASTSPAVSEQERFAMDLRSTLRNREDVQERDTFDGHRHSTPYLENHI